MITRLKCKYAKTFKKLRTIVLFRLIEKRIMVAVTLVVVGAMVVAVIMMLDTRDVLAVLAVLH